MSYSNPRDNPLNARLPNVNQPETILGVTISTLSLALIAVSLRLWVRLRDRFWSWDDVFVLLAGMASLSGDSMVCLMPKYGLGLHYNTLDNIHVRTYFKMVYSTNIAYCASATFIKLAILFQYLRLFTEPSPSTSSPKYSLARRVTISLIVLCSWWGITFFLLAVFPCNPIAKNWDMSIRDGKCIGWGSKEPKDFYAMFAAHNASNMFLDWLVLLTPLPFLRTLRLVGKSKAGLITLFSLGIFVCSASIGRLVSLVINKAGTVPVLDMSFHVPIVFIFSVLEVNIAIIAASIPIFWPVIVTLATNKIWVINEIEIRVETNSHTSFSTSGEIDLAEQGKWGRIDHKDEHGGRTVRSNILSKAYDYTGSRKHQHKRSNSSTVVRTLGQDIGGRNSNESQRILFPSAGREAGIYTSIGISGKEEWLAEADRQNVRGTSTTKIGTAEMPYEQIRKMEG